MKLNNNKLLENAIKAQQEGNLDEAEKSYQQILRTEPKQVDENHNRRKKKTNKKKNKKEKVLYKREKKNNQEIKQL